jgi:hypothetical protein
MSKNMIFSAIITILLLLFAGVLVLRITSNPATNSINSKPTITVEIKDQKYYLEVASTPDTRQKGLMNRSELPANSGMLFIFEGTGIYPFWMKNTLIPLDIIWLNQNKEIVHIKENAQPCETTIAAICNTIAPLKPALYVIELNAGDVQKLSLKTGDKIEFAL